MNSTSPNQVKTILVTGGVSGIGFSLAEELLSRGNNVYICGRRPANLENALINQKDRFGKRVAGIQCDVSNFVAVEKMVKDLIQKFNGLDVLVNNAGVGFVTQFEDISHEVWHEIIDVNLSGVFNCCKAALPHLKKSKCADIVNVGSRSGRYSFSGGVGYNTTKFGLQGFTEALFLDLAQYDIRVSLVAPGTVGTGFGGTPARDWHILPENVAHTILNMIGMNRQATLNWVEIRPSKTPIEFSKK